jgi:hypothetical protein
MAKKPKRPAKSAALSTWENYDKKISDWHKNKKRKEALIKKHH